MKNIPEEKEQSFFIIKLKMYVFYFTLVVIVMYCSVLAIDLIFSFFK